MPFYSPYVGSQCATHESSDCPTPFSSSSSASPYPSSLPSSISSANDLFESNSCLQSCLGDIFLGSHFPKANASTSPSASSSSTPSCSSSSSCSFSSSHSAQTPPHSSLESSASRLLASSSLFNSFSSSSPSLGLASLRPFIFANRNTMQKIDPDTFQVWTNLLRSVDFSHFWLIDSPTDATTNVKLEALSMGITPDRFIFSKSVERPVHMAVLGSYVDVYVDTPAYNGHSTATDVLWAASPLVALSASRMASRVSSSFLHSLGAGELSVYSFKAYEDLLLSLAVGI
eukprot:GILI01016626.1.p1 GENE.GILI01016626.1~~GILI01016626.1.p1  ORF type:complete len:331 (+),score=31.11 GILI01016626.1:135-995(+)